MTYMSEKTDMTNFPNFDFKIDCGDRPEVRRWLHDNGVTWHHGQSPTQYLARERLLCVSIAFRTVLTFNNHEEGYNRHDSKHIDPYQYMAEPTVADRMAALIEEYEGCFSERAKWLTVDRTGMYEHEHKPYPEDGYYESEQGICRLLLTSSEVDPFLVSHWRETLTELNPDAITDRRPPKPVLPENDSYVEMIQRDERERSAAELEWRLAQTDTRCFKPIPKPLTIPSICLQDTGFQMMLGGEHGGRCGE